MPITKSFWILIIDTVDVQITKWLHLSLFSSRRGRVGLRATTWLIHYKKNHRQPAVLLNSFKFCAPVVFVWFWLFFSCLRRRGWRYKRGSDITIFFPNIAFYFFTTIKWICSIVSSYLRSWCIYLIKKKLQTLEIQ